MQSHDIYLNRRNFNEHQGYGLYSERENNLLVTYGNWLNALAAGKIKATTPAQEHFVAVHNGDASPINEYEVAWKKFQEAKNKSKNLYKKARSIQKTYKGTESNSMYETIVKAYIEAANAGSYKAKQWLEHQSPSNIKPNSVWVRPEGFSGGRVNNRCGEDIIPLIPSCLGKK